MAAELTACPWCRQVPGPVLFAVANASLSVVCNCCGAHGPYADSEADAASAWSAAAGVSAAGQQTFPPSDADASPAANTKEGQRG